MPKYNDFELDIQQKDTEIVNNSIDIPPIKATFYPPTLGMCSY